MYSEDKKKKLGKKKKIIINQGQKIYSRAKIKNNQNSSTNYQYTGGQKKYSRAKIKNNQNSSTN